MKILKCIQSSSSGLIEGVVYFSKDIHENSDMYDIQSGEFNEPLPKDYSRHYGGYFKNRFKVLGEISLDNKLFKLVLLSE